MKKKKIRSVFQLKTIFLQYVIHLVSIQLIHNHTYSMVVEKQMLNYKQTNKQS